MVEWPTGLLRKEVDSLVLAIFVQPAAKRNSIEEIDVWRGRLHVAVKAPPEKGSANQAVCELFSESFGIPLANIEIISGHRSRQKSVRLHQVSHAEIESHLEAFRVE